MITRDIFDRVTRGMAKLSGKITHLDVLQALTEELGEYSRAVRVERKATLCHNKTVDEPAKVEIVDLMLVGVEAYIMAGGTFDELAIIADRKLEKWERLASRSRRKSIVLDSKSS